MYARATPCYGDIKQTLCEIIGVLRSLQRTMLWKIVGQNAGHWCEGMHFEVDLNVKQTMWLVKDFQSRA